jgi:predicted GH43/DUF377 family glycosyl hydrolase
MLRGARALTLLIPGLLTVGLVLPSAASACSQDDTAYFDGFLDASCLSTPLNNTTLDTFGGLRLTTTGTPVSVAWDTDTNFNTGATSDLTTVGPVGVSTLATDGSGNPASLILPTTPLPLARDGANPVLSPPPSAVLDNDNVDDPSVVKIGSDYYMWYSATAEDGSGPAIFLATSTDGQTWAKVGGGNPVPVLEGTPGAFDEHGVFGPDVIYDPGDPAAPLKMWYSGKGETFGAIGYATSTDGLSWTKHDDALTASSTDPVLDHGPAGAPDSFAAADPAVLKDGTSWRMWYTGDDSNKKRVAYAASADGVTWTKGGKVISPEDAGANANYEFGAWAPTVWKSGDGYRMLLAGRKLVSAGEFQTRIMGASSTDGISWTAPSPTLNPQSSRFDASNLNAPDVLSDPGTAAPFKLYYSGNTVDANGNFHSRIGLATSTTGTSFSRFDGPVGCRYCVLDIGAGGSDFDSREVSGLFAVAPTGANPKFVGFYWGNRGSDFKPRLGEATSNDGSSWTKVPVSGADGGAVFGLNTWSFDELGHLDPTVLYDVNGLGSDDYFLYFTAVGTSNDRSIGFASAQEAGGTHQPDNATWSARAQILGPGAGFDSAGVSHPSIIKDGTDYVLYYTGTDSSGTTAIGRAVSTAANGSFGSRSQVLTGSGDCDPDGRKDPVVLKAVSGYEMLYTGIEELDGQTIERACYATSADGTNWTREGVGLNPSQDPYSPDEEGVRPTGFLIDGATKEVFYSGIDRTGRVHSDHAATDSATQIPNGWASYQLGDETTEPRDFRTIARTSSGAVTLWMSYLQPYSTSGEGKQFWSDYFPVTVDDNPETLNFLLTVRGVRWQARLSDPATDPALDRVELDHAPIQFAPSGSALTQPIAPPPGVTVAHWDSLTVNTGLFAPTGTGSAGGTVAVLNSTGTSVLASTALATNGDTALSLGGISAATHPSLRVRFNLASASPYAATPLVRSLKVLYTAGSPPRPRCGGKVATIVGTPGPDYIKGTRRADVIAALRGNDVVKGLGRADVVCGGAGKDRLAGGARADRLFGNAGRDYLAGGKGRPDLCHGGKGIDRGARSCEIKRKIP